MTYLNLRSSGISILSLLFFIHLSISENSCAQNNFQPNIISPPSSSSVVLNNRTSPDNLNILGVMVEFQPDTNRFTSGRGTFNPGSIPYLEDPGTNIDALPHNQSYFEAHLEFVKNYYEKVSRNQISVDYQVLPEVYTLSKKMAEYSPIGEDPDLSLMASFVADVWTLIGQSESVSTNFKQGENIAFVIFHAGIGRDIELTGTNLDKTPQDLPSLYLSKKTLSQFLEDPSFSGFQIDNKNLLVDNSLIIPRTLTRSGTDAVGNRFIVPLSINGLLTAQIGSHLGLPDLFNTETGQSGIGRFGLMDGAAIFSYNGLFPPALSAWEKMYLGWETPFSVPIDTIKEVSLPALTNSTNKSIAQIFLSGSEYFLIENRPRDPTGTGIVVRIKKNDGTYVTQTFTNQDNSFVNQEPGFDELLEPGVIVDVSHFDFSLPGGLNTNENGLNRNLNGGILIWHIDEGVIRAKIAQGGINNNPDRKGVDLEEADGAQDIGLPTSVGLSQNAVNGSPFDFWWSGNDARVITQTDTIQLFQNQFGPDTTPNNNSNSEAPSHFKIVDFSDNKPNASFLLEPINPFADVYDLWDTKQNLDIETYADPSDLYWQNYPLAIQSMENGRIIIPGYNGIRFYNFETKELSDFRVNRASLQQPFSTENLLVISDNPFSITDNETLPVSIFQFDGESATELIEIQVQPNTAFVSSSRENILDIDGTSTQIDLKSFDVIQNEQAAQLSDRFGDFQSRIENENLIMDFPMGTEVYPLNTSDDANRMYTGMIRSDENLTFFYLLENGKLALFSSDQDFKKRTVIHDSNRIDWPAISDFDQDENPDFLFVDYSTNELHAKNTNGATLPSFPISGPQEVTFMGTPLIADINGDDINELIISAYDQSSMNLYAYNENGRTVNGFPLLIGEINNMNSQPVHPFIKENKIFAVSHAEELKVWDFKNMKNVQWGSKYGNQTNNKVSGFLELDTALNTDFRLLNSRETYNWPNPAKDDTHIRFQTSEPSDVRIKILTISGRVIWDQTIQSKGNAPEEILIDTSTWASGGYFALVEAKNNGMKESKVIKIAIVR